MGEETVRVVSAAASEGAKLHAAPAEFTFGGKTYHLAALDLDLEGRFEDWLVTEALARVRRYAGLLAGDPLEAENRVLRDAAAGGYARGSEAWATALASERGRKKLLYLRLKRNHPYLTEAEAEAIYEADLARVLERVMNAMDAADQPGNPPAPRDLPGGTSPSPAGTSIGPSSTPTPGSPPSGSGG